MTSCARYYGATAALPPNRDIHDPTLRHYTNIGKDFSGVHAHLK
jgi:hypothetical protein